MGRSKEDEGEWEFVALKKKKIYIPGEREKTREKKLGPSQTNKVDQ